MDSQHGERTLVGHNKEFVRSIADLKMRRAELQSQIYDDESLKSQIEQQIETVMRRIDQLSESIRRRAELREGYEKVITETERSYNQILDESESLLGLLHTSTTHFERLSHGGYDTVEAIV